MFNISFFLITSFTTVCRRNGLVLAFDYWFQKRQARSILFRVQQRIVLLCFIIWTLRHAQEPMC